MGHFAKSADSRSLARGLASYVTSGLGGSQRATKRMGATIRNAGSLYGVLDTLRSGGDLRIGEIELSAAALAGLSPREAADRIVDAIRPAGGTLDGEANRTAMNEAFADLIESSPEVDLTALNDEQLELVTERYVGYDVAARVELDLGKQVLQKAPDAPAGYERLAQIRVYVCEAVSAAFRAARERGQKLVRSVVARITTRVIRDTFTVFEAFE